jgi:hypothetical protein
MRKSHLRSQASSSSVAPQPQTPLTISGFEVAKKTNSAKSASQSPAKNTRSQQTKGGKSNEISSPDIIWEVNENYYFEEEYTNITL